MSITEKKDKTSSDRRHGRVERVQSNLSAASLPIFVIRNVWPYALHSLPRHSPSLLISFLAYTPRLIGAANTLGMSLSAF
jgi:hypothetical protein